MTKYKIGIDTSTTNTAMVVLDLHNDIERFILFSPVKKKDIIERSTIICKELCDTLYLFDEKDALIGIEGASFMSKGKRDKLVMLTGCVYYNLLMRGYNVILIPPTTIKKEFTGNGRASKEEVINTVSKEIREMFLSKYKKIDDLSDAYAIASIL